MKIAIGMIKEELRAATIGELPVFIEKYHTDERKGVQKMCLQAKKRMDAFEVEKLRTKKMYSFEEEYADYKFICGIDEVGRGPLAGPVMAGAVILPKDEILYYLNDSKKLSAAKREDLYQVIMDKAIATGIGSALPAKIDEINILQATYEAMREAINKLEFTPDIILIDAVRIPDIEIPQVPIIKGDAKSASIAAASIISKVTRDRLMVEYDQVLPQYGFKSNKGYGSAGHIAAIKEHGISPIHRKSFIKNFI